LKGDGVGGFVVAVAHVAHTGCRVQRWNPLEHLLQAHKPSFLFSLALRVPAAAVSLETSPAEKPFMYAVEVQQLLGSRTLCAARA
jgi:hypothetical protein